MKLHHILGALSALFVFANTQISAHQSKPREALLDESTNTIKTVKRAATEAAVQPLRALQITAATAPQLVRQGPDAIGGIGDWFISNGTLCAIISDLEHEGEFSARGGALVDLGFCGRADDYFSATYDLLQGSQRRPMLAQSIEAQVSDNSATIIVISSQDGAQLETRYSLNPLTPSQLHIQKHLIATEGEDFNFLSTVHFNLRSLEPFIFSSKELMNSNGFEQEDFVERGLSAIESAARVADTLITISPPDADNGIAYGWHIKSSKKTSSNELTQAPSFLLADEWSNAALFLTEDFYIGGNTGLGWLELIQIPLLGLDKNESLETQEIIYVGKHGNVASITDQLFLEQGELKQLELVSVVGQINDKDSAIHINMEDGTPVSHTRPDARGNFSLKLPKGSYQLLAKATAQRSHTQTLLANKAVNEVNIELSDAAQLQLPQGHAMRLVFVPLGDTPAPHFTDTLTGFLVHDDNGARRKPAVNQIFLAGVAGDKKEIALAPGQYQIYATRGPEYSLEKTTLELSAGDKHNLDIAVPKHINPTPGFIASDLHVHSGFSFDNAFAERERVRTFAAEQGEVMVASEHDVAVDYAPIIKKMGLTNQIASIQAIEATSLLPTDLNPYTNGHANFFPFTPTPYAYRGGVLNHEDKRWREVLANVREQHPNVLAQLNHPRRNLALSGETLPSDFEDIIDNGQFLDHMGSAAHPFNPHKPLNSHPNNVLIEPHSETGVRDIDFDLIEVANPGSYYKERTQAVRLDWLAFLKQGIRMVATANSDSHNASQQVAVPRNMVAVKTPSVPDFEQDDFLSSLKAGNSYGTTGPMLEIRLDNHTMGETFNNQRGELWVKISTTPWIDVSRIDVQINGITVDSYPLNKQLVQELLVPLAFFKDSFVTVEVHGQASEDYQAVYPGLEPYAFSNPIYVDFDADGEWTPPGL